MIQNKHKFIKALFSISFLFGITIASSVEQELKCQPNCHSYPPVTELVNQLNYMEKRPNEKEFMVRQDWLRDRRFAVCGVPYRLRGVSPAPAPTVWNLWGKLRSPETVYLPFPLKPEDVSIFSTQTTVNSENDGVIDYTYMHRNPVTGKQCTLHVSQLFNDAGTVLMDREEMYNLLHKSGTE